MLWPRCLPNRMPPLSLPKALLPLFSGTGAPSLAPLPGAPGRTQSFPAPPWSLPSFILVPWLACSQSHTCLEQSSTWLPAPDAGAPPKLSTLGTPFSNLGLHAIPPSHSRQLSAWSPPLPWTPKPQAHWAPLLKPLPLHSPRPVLSLTFPL